MAGFQLILHGRFWVIPEVTDILLSVRDTFPQSHESSRAVAMTFNSLPPSNAVRWVQ
jgi:hypothetical protein